MIRQLWRLVGPIGALLLCAHVTAGLIGIDQERRIGRQVADELERKYGLVRGEAIVERVQAVGAKVAQFAKEDRPRIDYVFHVLADKQINAVACPGGYMYAFRGLVKRMPEEELLAAVLAHECAHVSQRHGMETLERSLGLSLLLGLFTGGESDLGNAALGILMRGYSRNQEAEADRVGHIYLYKAGYDVGAMARMLQRLDELTEEGGSIPNFLRTHPSGEARIEAAQRREAEILLEFGSLRPPPDPPRLGIVYQSSEDESEATRTTGEAVARQLADQLTACGQFDAVYVGPRTVAEAERTGVLAQLLAADQSLDSAIGLYFTAAPVTPEASGRKAKVKIGLSVSMIVLSASSAEPQFTYNYATREEWRDADEEKQIEASVRAKTDEVARALALQVLRPTAQEVAPKE